MFKTSMQFKISDKSIDMYDILKPAPVTLLGGAVVQEVVKAVKQFLRAELEFDIFLVINGQEVHFIMQPIPCL